MYIDPNTGGMLFQTLIGLLALISGVLFFFYVRPGRGLPGCGLAVEKTMHTAQIEQ